MKLQLRLLDLHELERLRIESAESAGLSIVEGALPPGFIIDAAVEALASGAPKLWHSFFLFVNDEDAEIVGSGGFKGPPIEGGVEIGYGVAESRRGQGIATDSVREMVKVASNRPEISVVTAETAVDNPASQRVLEKAGFRRIGERWTEEDGMVYRWIIDCSEPRIIETDTDA